MSSDTPKDKATRLITNYIGGETGMKRSSSMLSPPEQVQEQKRPILMNLLGQLIVMNSKTPLF